MTTSTAMSSPQTWTKTADINAIIQPPSPDNFSTCFVSPFRLSLDEVPNKKALALKMPLPLKLPFCHHCRSVCILYTLNGEYSVACEDALIEVGQGQDLRTMGSSPKIMRQCRYMLYHQMAIRCLALFAAGERKKLPICVVQDIFPDPGGLTDENKVRIYFYRPVDNPTTLILEPQASRWIFNYQEIKLMK
jgi:hypothetical protein